jgi:hypothetical protein
MMSRSDFIQWKKAFTEFVGCGRSTADKAECIAGWEKGAASFIDEEHRGYVRSAAEYYVMTRLRSPAEEQQKYCKPLRA